MSRNTLFLEMKDGKMDSSTNKCFMSNRDPSKCGDFKGSSDLVRLVECRNEITAHLKRCHLSKSGISNEGELILARAGVFEPTTQQFQLFVCPRHRANFGEYWGNQSRNAACHHPDHKGNQKGVKNDRVVSLKIAREIQQMYAIVIPVGAPICNSCRKKHGERRKKEWDWSSEVPGFTEDKDKGQLRKCKEVAIEAITSCTLPETPSAVLVSRREDTAWTPGQWHAASYCDSFLDDDDGDVLKLYNDSLTQIASLSEMKIPLTTRLRFEWQSASESEKKNCKEVLDEGCKALSRVIAPLASNELLAEYKDASIRGRGESALVAAYKDAPTKSLKTQILSIYAPKYTTEEPKQMHGEFEQLSDRQIKKAKAHARNVGTGLSLPKTVYHRTRIDLSKLNHFLSFADQPYYYQDVSYGTRILKLQSGETIMMPNVVRTVTRSTMIAQYFKQCSDEGFEPLSRSTLFKILNVRESSQRKSLQGLDNIAASGADGFEMLHKVVDDLEQCGTDSGWCEVTRTNLRDGKRYLKTEYRAHCRDADSTCPDHCKRHALSDPHKSEFQATCDHAHDTACQQCECLKKTLSSIITEIQSPSTCLYGQEQIEDLLYDANKGKEMVLQWKAHILRAENQDQAKHNALRSLDSNTVLVVMDWAMKFTQMKYREKQSEWYGKRGINWHVSCIISTSGTKQELEIASYVHLFDSCAQNWFAVCAIITHLLKTAKKAQPRINKAFLRSDGAGYYYNNNLIIAVREMSKHVGIQILRYDFSEAQFGKDVCDRIISPLKSSLRRYCDEGNDILSASDMHHALEARNVKGTTAAVCELDFTQAAVKLDKIPSFSSFHNFSYQPEGIVMHQAYGIGPGKTIKWEALKMNSQGPITATEISSQESFFPFTARSMTSHASRDDDTDSHNTAAAAQFECKEPGCPHTFSSLEALQDHVCFGEHRLNRNEDMYDKLKREWAHKFATLSLNTDSKPTDIYGNVAAQTCKTTSLDWTPEPRGWALQKPRGGRAEFSENVRAYLRSRFDTGAQTGRKADPNQVSKDMRNAKNHDGTRKFSRDEWLTKTQIQSFFSRLAAIKRKQGKDHELTEEEVDDDQLLEDEIEFVTEKRRHQVIENVLDQAGLVHPIMYEGYNICEVVNLGKLSQFKVRDLRNMCDHFEVSYKAKDTKGVLTEKIKVWSENVAAI